MVRLLLILGLLLPALAGMAEPLNYRLDPAGSELRFGYKIGGIPAEGTMPVKSAEMVIDLARLGNSRAVVVLDVNGTRAASQIATDALKSESVLDAAAHPEISFRSDSVTGSVAEGARISGRVTIRGVTRPLVLSARLYRPPDSDPGDRDRLTVLLTGSIQRSAFGASGYPDLVADRVDLRIRAALRLIGR
ncbi:YceI family protein [Poseidonocella sp. HB161398]|uniref:YceI family protein n=1 Tax=Poseidonocella sp. HB161398 TaxID=2320855 RepID=UPI001108A08E|nr:YceI family protein [Poseidonocella sp. HB161398]